MPPPELPQKETGPAEAEVKKPPEEVVEGKKLTAVPYDRKELEADLAKDARGESASVNLDQRGRTQGQKIRMAYGDNRLPT